MSWLAPDRIGLWKDAAARRRRRSRRPRAAVGATLGRIHAYSAAQPGARGAVRQRRDLLRHPPRALPARDGAPPPRARAGARAPRRARRRRTRLALVHGDVSPKNILVGAHGPVLLDAECAWWGDPAFDVAFCLNHLLLKCLWTPAASGRFLAAFAALATAYRDAVDWEPRGALEARAAALLPGLLLARVDGKSPVEYITDEARPRARAPRRRRAAAAAAGRGSTTSPATWRERAERRAMNTVSHGDCAHRRRPRAPRLGQPRPADGRGRGRARRRRLRPRDRAGRRLERHARGARAARRRQRLRRPRRAARGRRTSNGEIAARRRRPRRRRPGRASTRR